MDPRRPARLRDKLPEITLEAVSVVFAVLLALAVNEWRDQRDDREVAAQARRSIEAEVAENRADLGRALQTNASALRALATSSPAVPDSAVEVGLSLELAQLSSAAFGTAQATGAASGIEFGWLLSAARAYDLQELYGRRQEGLLDELGGAAGSPDGPDGIRNRLRQVQALGDSLHAAYELVLAHEATPP